MAEHVVYGEPIETKYRNNPGDWCAWVVSDPLRYALGRTEAEALKRLREKIENERKTEWKTET